MKKASYISDILEYRISTVALRDDNILHIKIKSDELFGANDFYDLMDAAYKIGKGKRFLNLIDVGMHTTADNDARKISASQEGSKYKLADAFIIYSLPQKIVGNFYLKINKPVYPTRFHDCEKEALKWLNQFTQLKK